MLVADGTLWRNLCRMVRNARRSRRHQAKARRLRRPELQCAQHQRPGQSPRERRARPAHNLRPIVPVGFTFLQYMSVQERYCAVAKRLKALLKSFRVGSQERGAAPSVGPLGQGCRSRALSQFGRALPQVGRALPQLDPTHRLTLGSPIPFFDVLTELDRLGALGSPLFRRSDGHALGRALLRWWTRRDRHLRWSRSRGFRRRHKR